MENANSIDQLQVEQDAFDAALSDLMLDHKGEFVVFKDQKPVGFFKSFQAAYESGLRRFGLDSVFLVSPVGVQPNHSSSLSWDLGVL